ncbi:CcdB family protein [Entomobacter blattae]|uniref:Toxin CcdB n=1 Tax=Entomobacter blattae TaxID=2762277 RepID=A0A7H1NRQ0_9PROT|nr:CcdB family protein [Entomobacter blattae]QNT78460.1 Toxin CcdB [Entomobacter blattae]
MARFDVYVLLQPKSVDYVLNVQSDLLEQLNTRMVVPLLSKNSLKPIRDLNPVFTIEGKEYMMMTQAMASISQKELKQKVCSLENKRDEIIHALDILLTGF